MISVLIAAGNDLPNVNTFLIAGLGSLTTIVSTLGAAYLARGQREIHKKVNGNLVRSENERKALEQRLTQLEKQLAVKADRENRTGKKERSTD